MSIRNLGVGSFWMICFVIIMTVFSSCRKTCEEINCNNGECNNGRCNCYTGWGGKYCDVKISENFIGNWAVSEVCTNANDTYFLTITESVFNSSVIVLDNLYAPNTLVEATIDPGDARTIYITNYYDGFNYYNGTGNLDFGTGTLTINFTVDDGISPETCEAVLTPQ